MIVIKKELEDILENRTRGAMIRSKAYWFEGGEKPTKYFFRLEKRNAMKKAISRL